MGARESLRGEATGWGGAWKQALGYSLAGAFLVWVFHDIHVERMLAHIGSMSWWWIPAAVVCDILSYCCEGVRWHYLLLPAGRLPVLRATQAVYIGLFTNEVTPLRFGELVRTYLASRWLKRPISAVIPSMLVGRLLDGAWLAVGVGAIAILMPLPKDLLVAGDVFGLVVLGLVGAFLLLVLWKRKTVSKWGEPVASGSGVLFRLRRMAGQVAQGIVEIGTFRTLAMASVFSLGLLALQALSFWLVMKSYRLPLPLVAGAAVFLVVHFGTAIPNAPANVGSYQFFTVVGLGLFGVEKTLATGFSIVVFIILTLPLWVLGLLALWGSGTTLAGIRADLGRIKMQHQDVGFENKPTAGPAG